MEKSFLLELGLTDEVAEKIMECHAGELDDMRSSVASAAEEARLRDKYDYVLKSRLSSAGARNIPATIAALGYTYNGVDFDDEPEGLGDAISKLASDAPYLFGEIKKAEPETIYTFVGISPVEESDISIDPDELSYSEYMRLYH